jgi:hypothetical protein
VTGPLASSPRRPTLASPGPVVQCQPTKPRSPRAATPPRHLPADLHARLTACAPRLLLATVSCRVAVTCFAATATCLPAAAPLLSSLASTTAPLLPPLLLPAALLLSHPEQLLHEHPSTLQPQADSLSSKQKHQRDVTGAALLPSRASTTSAYTGPPLATPAPPRVPPESQGPQRPLQRQPRPLLRFVADDSSPPEHAIMESYPR